MRPTAGVAGLGNYETCRHTTKNEYGTPASEKLQSRLNTLLREQKTLQKRREALRTNEFFPNDFPP